MLATPLHSSARAAHPAVILAVLCLAQLMVVVDITIVNVSLASIQDDLGLTPSGLQYVVTAYLITLGGFLLVAGRSADLFGRRRTLMAGAAVFAAASLAAALARSDWQLLVPRAIQGVGAALITTSALSTLTTVFAEGPDRNRALGIWGAVTGGGSAVGVVVGGALTDGPGWRWIFWINVPIGVAATVVAWRVLPPGRRDPATRLDLSGAFTLTAGLLALVVAISRAEMAGWVSTSTLATFALAGLLLAGFRVVEARASQPLIRFAIFRQRQLSGANAVAMAVFAAMTAMFFVASLLMQRVLGYTPLQTGAVYVPLSICFLLGAQVASRLLQRSNPRRLLSITLPAAAVGFVLLARIPTDGSYLVDLLGPTVLIGLALGASMVPIQVAAFSGVESAQSGLAAGLVNTSQEVGGALGVAVLSTLAASQTARLGGATQGVTIDALLTGYQRAFIGGAVLLGVALILAITLLDRPCAHRRHADDLLPTDIELEAAA